MIISISRFVKMAEKKKIYKIFKSKTCFLESTFGIRVSI